MIDKVPGKSNENELKGLIMKNDLLPAYQVTKIFDYSNKK